MKEFIIDSCVFFNFLSIHEETKDNLDELVKSHKNNKKLNKELEGFFYDIFEDKFKEKHKSKIDNKEFSRFELIELYKEYVKNEETILENEINKLDLLSRGLKEVKHKVATPEQISSAEETFYYEEKGIKTPTKYHIPIFVSEKEKQEAREKKENLKEELAKRSLWTKLQPTIERYEKLNEIIKIYPIYKDMLEGKFQPIIVPPIAHELIDHLKEKPDNPNWITIKKDILDPFVEKYVKLVTVRNKKVMTKINSLAAEFREPSTEHNLKNMSNSKKSLNALGRHGDSLIMAYAVYTGYNLLTLNGKDFIFEKGKEKNNENIRKYIEFVSKRNGYTSGALAYSPVEYKNSEISTPIKNLENIKHIKFPKTTHPKNFSDQNFENTY